MANRRISQLRHGGPEQAGDQFAAERNGETLRVTLPDPGTQYKGVYDAGTEYGAGDYVSDTGTGPNRKYYISRSDNNQGNALTSTTYWAALRERRKWQHRALGGRGNPRPEPASPRPRRRRSRHERRESNAAPCQRACKRDARTAARSARRRGEGGGSSHHQITAPTTRSGAR